jgi:hypothetical protein
MSVAMLWRKLQKKVHVSILSLDMTKRTNKIKIMSSEIFQEGKKVYGSARNSAILYIFYIAIKY